MFSVHLWIYAFLCSRHFHTSSGLCFIHVVPPSLTWSAVSVSLSLCSPCYSSRSSYKVGLPTANLFLCDVSYVFQHCHLFISCWTPLSLCASFFFHGDFFVVIFLYHRWLLGKRIDWRLKAKSLKIIKPWHDQIFFLLQNFLIYYVFSTCTYSKHILTIIFLF